MKQFLSCIVLLLNWPVPKGGRVSSFRVKSGRDIALPNAMYAGSHAIGLFDMKNDSIPWGGFEPINPRAISRRSYLLDLEWRKAGCPDGKSFGEALECQRSVRLSQVREVGQINKLAGYRF